MTKQQIHFYTYKGIRYKNMKEAREALAIGDTTFKAMVKNGAIIKHIKPKVYEKETESK